MQHLLRCRLQQPGAPFELVARFRADLGCVQVFINGNLIDSFPLEAAYKEGLVKAMGGKGGKQSLFLTVPPFELGGKHEDVAVHAAWWGPWHASQSTLSPFHVAGGHAGLARAVRVENLPPLAEGKTAMQEYEIPLRFMFESFGVASIRIVESTEVGDGPIAFIVLRSADARNTAIDKLRGTANIKGRKLGIVGV